jgi:hypothetical protein
MAGAEVEKLLQAFDDIIVIKGGSYGVASVEIKGRSKAKTRRRYRWKEKEINLLLESHS